MASLGEIDHMSDQVEEDVVCSKEGGGNDRCSAFGVLQACWTVLKDLTCSQYWLCNSDVMYACIILYNMIIEKETMLLISNINNVILAH